MAAALEGIPPEVLPGADSETLPPALAVVADPDTSGVPDDLAVAYAVEPKEGDNLLPAARAP